MTIQQEYWYRTNLARRQAMIAAVTRIRYQAAGGGAGGEKKEEPVVVPAIPAPADGIMSLVLSDGRTEHRLVTFRCSGGDVVYGDSE